MTLELVMPDIVKLCVAFLRAQPEVTTLLGASASVRGALVKNTLYPAVKVMRITSEPIQIRPHLVEAVRVQLDCYGGNNRQAERVAQAVRASMCERMRNYKNDEGIVTNIIPRGMDDQVDDSMEPARERYIVEMEVWVKPLLGG